MDTNKILRFVEPKDFRAGSGESSDNAGDRPARAMQKIINEQRTKLINLAENIAEPGLA
jgi:hypothetical protein